jgi:hypothetical protein
MRMKALLPLLFDGLRGDFQARAILTGADRLDRKRMASEGCGHGRLGRRQ